MIWLVELTLGGRVYRFAETRVEVDTLLWEAGLSAPSVSYADVAAPDAAVPITIVTDTVDWAAVAAAGDAVDRGPAALYRWRPGQTLREARCVFRGFWGRCSWGAVGEPLVGQIRREGQELSDLTPSPDAAVSSDTWPVTTDWSRADDTDGAAYPVVIGVPGDTGTGAKPAVPVPVAEVAGGDSDGRVVWLGGDADDVVLFDLSAEPRGLNWERGAPWGYAVRSVTALEDELGRTVQSARAGDLWHPGGEWWVGFSDAAGRGGGLRWRGRRLRGAGDVLTWALDGYRGAVDHGRLRAIAPTLNAYQVDTYLSAPVTRWEWAVAELLPWLPVAWCESTDGVYPRWVRWSATARDVVATLDARSLSRESPVTLASDEVVNEVTVEFRESGRGRWLGRRTVSSSTRARDRDRWIADPVATASQARYGLRATTLQLHHTWDAATAVLVARDTLARLAWPRRTVAYHAPSELDLERRLELGDVVHLVDSSLSLDGRALVLDLTPTDAAGVVVDLALLDRP